MSNFNLGLEALAEQPVVEMTGDILSYEYLDTVMQFNDAAAEAVVIADGIGAIAGAMENLGAICEVLKAHGNSPALEALVGSNFKEGFSLEAAEKAKEGLWARFVKWLKTLWAKIKAMFAHFFVSAKKMKDAVDARIKELQTKEMKEVSINMPGVAVFKATKIFIETSVKDLVDKIVKFGESAKDGGANVDEVKSIVTSVSGKGAEFIKQFNESAASETKKDTAIAMLTGLSEMLDVLIKAKAWVDAAAKIVSTYSDNLNPKNFAKKGEQEEQFAKNDEGAEILNGLRSVLMEGHSFISKSLATFTRRTVAYSSMALSAFKPVSVEK